MMPSDIYFNDVLRDEHFYCYDIKKKKLNNTSSLSEFINFLQTNVQETSMRNEGVKNYELHLSSAWVGYCCSFVLKARNIVSVSATDCSGTKIRNLADLSSQSHSHHDMT